MRRPRRARLRCFANPLARMKPASGPPRSGGRSAAEVWHDMPNSILAVPAGRFGCVVNMHVNGTALESPLSGAAFALDH
jgi:hypothetical protein